MNKSPTLILFPSNVEEVLCTILTYLLMSDIHIFSHQSLTIPENISGFANLNWLVRVDSTEDFGLMMGSRDIPIDSNVYLYSGNISHYLTLHDVYRPAPNLELRQGRDVITLWLIRSFLPQADHLRCLEPHTRPPALTGGQAGVEDRPERGGDQGHLRDRTSFLSD